MSFLQTITPINLLEEKEKFLSDTSYNPQFKYSEPIDQKKLYKFGQPQKKYLELAQKIVDEAYHNRNEQDLVMMKGPVQTQAQVTKKIKSFLKMHHLEKRYEIVWSSSFISRVTITSKTIKLKSIAEFRKDDTIGMLYHEIGTHALRRLNYEKQPWYKKKKKNGLTTNYLRTEEGLAALHSLIPLQYKSAYATALRYLAVDISQQKSFSELWKFLTRYVDNIETRWMICVRQKRGIENTSKSGGYTKDLVYFEGMVEVCKWLSENNFDPTQLYFGKIATQDTEKTVTLNPSFKPILPSFYMLSPEEYQNNLLKIGKLNDFNKT